MGRQTHEVEPGACSALAADQVQAKVGTGHAAQHAAAAIYDLSDLNLAPEVVARIVGLKPEKIEEHEARVAGWLAASLVGLLGTGTLLYVILAFLVSVQSGLEAGTRILCFLTPLVGVVVGYYFSGKRQRS